MDDNIRNFRQFLPKSRYPTGVQRWRLITKDSDNNATTPEATSKQAFKETYHHGVAVIARAHSQQSDKAFNNQAN